MKGVGVALSICLSVCVSACGARIDPTPTPVSLNQVWTPRIQEFDGVLMAYVPNGCFIMGSDAGRRDERPAHEQCLTHPYWIDVFEVTNARFGSDGPYIGADRPRTNITWIEARDHCAARGSRLPTEREWEYAARGPNGWRYPWGNVLVETAFNNDRRHLETSAVGSFPAGRSWIGAYDLSGNVWEWTASVYRPYPYDLDGGREDTSTATEPRVFRGGWLTYQEHAASAITRFRMEVEGRDWRIGFRCARD